MMNFEGRNYPPEKYFIDNYNKQEERLGFTPYRQCRLQRKIPTGVQIQVAWIPLVYAIEGEILTIKEEKGWLVMTATGPIMLEEDVDMEAIY